jgi:hypothetical protein
MLFGGLEFVALKWLGTHVLTGAVQGAGHALASNTAAHAASNIILNEAAKGAATNVASAASSNFWTWVGGFF